MGRSFAYLRFFCSRFLTTSRLLTCAEVTLIRWCLCFNVKLMSWVLKSTLRIFFHLTLGAFALTIYSLQRHTLGSGANWRRYRVTCIATRKYASLKMHTTYTRSVTSIILLNYFLRPKWRNQIILFIITWPTDVPQTKPTHSVFTKLNIIRHNVSRIIF